MAGMIGRILHVDLNRAETEIRPEELSPALMQKMLGGVGIASHLVSTQVAPGADALDPSSCLVFMTGPLTGTTFPAATRFAVVARSPLSGMLYHGGAAGSWGPELKAAGFDGIIVEGKAAKPVYLSVNEASAELRDATAYWGLGAVTSQEQIKKDLGQTRAQAISIGPAGERMARIAAIVGDTLQASIFGGLGAVMGSKNLKAIVVRGRRRVPVANEAGLTDIARKVSTFLAGNRNLSTLRAYGTPFGIESGISTGEVPTKNWRVFDWREQYLQLGGKRIADSYRQPYAPCANCPVRCFSKVEVPGTTYAVSAVTPQYDALAALGPLCFSNNLESVCYASHLCDEYGLDPTAVGSAIAFALEAFEKGLITRQDAGRDLSWGDPETIVTLADQIGKGEHLGQVLGNGVKWASEQIPGSAEFALHLKGLPVPMHDPRAFFGLAVTYATDLPGDPTMFDRFLVMPEIGITHKTGRFDRAGKGLAAKAAQDYYALFDCAGICPLAIPALPPALITVALEAATGSTRTSGEVMAIGERTANVERLYAMACGVRIESRLPVRLMTPAPSGPHAGRVANLADQLREYCELRGWDAAGKPTQHTMDRLGLVD